MIHGDGKLLHPVGNPGYTSLSEYLSKLKEFTSDIYVPVHLLVLPVYENPPCKSVDKDKMKLKLLTWKLQAYNKILWSHGYVEPPN